MNYIITALDAEARPLIDHYRLKRDMSLPYTIYTGDEITLIITGIGRINAMMGVSALLGWKRPKKNDILINIGVCGAPSHYGVREALLIHQIITPDKTYYPDILYSHTFAETSISCVDAPQSTPNQFPVDMESGGIFLAASRFFQLHQMAFLKIVSDHYEPHLVTKELVISLMHSHLNSLDTLIQQLRGIAAEPSLFSDDEIHMIEQLKEYFTKSQGDALDDALRFFRLKSPGRALPLEIEKPTSKHQRSQLHEQLIRTLVS